MAFTSSVGALIGWLAVPSPPTNQMNPRTPITPPRTAPTNPTISVLPFMLSILL
jgi:hypothetical protein